MQDVGIVEVEVPAGIAAEGSARVAHDLGPRRIRVMLQFLQRIELGDGNCQRRRALRSHQRDEVFQHLRGLGTELTKVRNKSVQVVPDLSLTQRVKQEDNQVGVLEEGQRLAVFFPHADKHRWPRRSGWAPCSAFP